MKHSSTHRSPAEILMYGHHRASGGSTIMGSMPSNQPHFQGEAHLKRGGSGRPKPYMRNGRSCHAEGDSVGEMGLNPVNGYKYPESPEAKRRGGRARSRHADGNRVEGLPYRFAEGDSVYAEGDTVDAVPYRKGGRTHSHRRHHSEGGDAYNEGGDVYAEGGDISDHLRRGGRARRHHSEGGDVYAEGGHAYNEGGDVDREHHNFGDTVGSIASAVLPFLSFLKKGGSAHNRRRHHSEGGNTYDEGGNVYAEGGDTSDHLRRGGRARRHHAEGGDTYNEGGDVDREHHNFGDTVGSIASAVLPFLSFLKKGGPAHNRRRHHSEGEEVALKRAMGGVGKLRKGMMR